MLPGIPGSRVRARSDRIPGAPSPQVDRGPISVASAMARTSTSKVPLSSLQGWFYSCIADPRDPIQLSCRPKNTIPRQGRCSCIWAWSALLWSGSQFS